MNKQNQWLFEVPPAFENTESSFELSGGEWEVGVKPSTVRRPTQLIQQMRLPAARSSYPKQQVQSRSKVARSRPRPTNTTNYAPGRPSQSPLPSARPLTYADVRSDRIDVHAQKALLRMSKNPAMSVDAAGIAVAVKSGKLGGIYKEDEKVPALRARKMNSSWWLIIPEGEDAILFLDPEKPKTGTPIIVFRDSVRSNFARLDPALQKAWKTYVSWQIGTQTGKVQQCGQITPNGIIMARTSTHKAFSNLSPPIFCFSGGAANGSCSHEVPNPCKPKCPTETKPIGRRLSFQEMWDMIISHYYCELPKNCECKNCCENPKKLKDIFSPELLIAIFWEETRFQNIGETVAEINPCGPGTGFGQVNPDGWTRASFCGIKTPTRNEILCDDKLAVQIAGLYLWDMFCRSTSDKDIEKKIFALKGYAAAFPKQNPQKTTKTDSQWEAERLAIIRGWLKSENYLKEIRKKEQALTLDELRNVLKYATEGKPAQGYSLEKDEACVFPNAKVPILSYDCASAAIRLKQGLGNGLSLL